MRKVHFGKYEELDSLRKEDLETDWEYLEEEMIDTEEIDLLSSYDFLHGYCDVFAQALSNTMPEYQRESIYDSEGQLVHTYCTIVKDGVRWFADVRGVTSDYAEFIAEFDDYLGYVSYPKYPIAGTKPEENIVSELLPEEYEILYRAAEFIIDQYWNTYKIG